ncbi:unnamed protein product [Closterium sp. NIES-53]
MPQQPRAPVPMTSQNRHQVHFTTDNPVPPTAQQHALKLLTVYDKGPPPQQRAAVRHETTVQFFVPPRDRRTDRTDKSDHGTVNPSHVRRPHHLGIASATHRIRVQQLAIRHDPTVTILPELRTRPYSTHDPEPRQPRTMPFRISHMITPVTAHLLLPADWYVSPSFHVSLLRPYIPSTSQLARNRPARMTRPPTKPVITLEKIMSHRVRDPRGARRVEFLIRRRDRTPTEDSWVPLDKIENHPVLNEYLRSRNFKDMHALS